MFNNQDFHTCSTWQATYGSVSVVDIYIYVCICIYIYIHTIPHT